MPPRQPVRPTLPTQQRQFYRSALHQLLRRINAYLVRWIRKKYKRLRGFKKAKACWDGITHRYPNLFAHWRYARDFWPPAMTGAG